MKINYLDLLYSIAEALDCVERQLNNETTNHSLNVAYLCIKAGRYANFAENDVIDIAICALLHDNALSEYIASEYETGHNKEGFEQNGKGIKLHCIVGENNIVDIRFLGKNSKNAVLYHHESADGSGPFGKTYEEVGIFARLIYLANELDLRFPLRNLSLQDYDKLREYITNKEGTQFDSECVSIFLEGIKFTDYIELGKLDLKTMIYQELEKQYVELTEDEMISFGKLFAKIIDYKSSITKKHTEGVARRAYEMAKYYHYSSEKAAKFYLAGALHDIGKLVVDSDILEKESRLTPSEYQHIKGHAYATYELLKQIEGMEDILEWAAYHHERLDGTGYPFGLTADRLTQEARLMACIDIYQALVEERSYKQNMEHEEAMKIINQLAKEGKLDEKICHDLDVVYGGKN